MLTPTVIFALLATLAQAEPSMELPHPNAFDARVRVVTQSGAMGSQGVWLERPDGSRLLVATDTDNVWALFDGQSVQVTGELVTPDPSSNDTQRYGIHTLDIKGTETPAVYIQVGPPMDLEGHIQVRHGEPGSKAADDSWLVLATRSLTYQLANPGKLDGHLGPVSVTARAMTRSPFATYMPGPTLWIQSVHPTRDHGLNSNPPADAAQ